MIRLRRMQHSGYWVIVVSWRGSVYEWVVTKYGLYRI